MWEDWEGSRFASRNHYAQGAVCQWLFEYAAGIRVEGENRFGVEPKPGGTLDWAQASYRSLYGEIQSRWKRAGDQLLFTITVPAGTTAEIRLPDGSCHRVGAGEHRFVTREGGRENAL